MLTYPGSVTGWEHFKQLFELKGSVFNQIAMAGMVSCFMVLLLELAKLFSEDAWIQLTPLKYPKGIISSLHPLPLQVFGNMLGFALVFKVTMSYSRYKEGSEQFSFQDNV